MRYRNKKTRGGAVQQNHVQDVNPRAKHISIYLHIERIIKFFKELLTHIHKCMYVLYVYTYIYINDQTKCVHTCALEFRRRHA